MTLTRCMHCFAAGACLLKFTKKGLPYTTCRVCFTRSFFHNLDALRGVAVCPDLIEQTLNLVAAGEAPWVQQRVAEMASWARDRITGKGLHESTAEPIPYVEPAVAGGASTIPGSFVDTFSYSGLDTVAVASIRRAIDAAGLHPPDHTVEII